MRDLIERLEKATRDLVNDCGTDSYRVRCELYDIAKELKSKQNNWTDADTIDFAIWAAACLVNRGSIINPKLLAEFKTQYKPQTP